VSILIVSTIGISDSAVAEVFEKYCLSTVGQVKPINESEREIPRYPIPPFIGSVDHLPELYRKSCNAFSRFFDACTRETLFYYSPALDRVFFQGYRPTRWGGGFVHLEISEEGTKSVPSELVNSGFMENVPALNGVLFKGRSKREALFYDGSRVTNLSQYFHNQNNTYRSNPNWYFTATSNERFFLVVDFIGSKKEPFLMELEPEANFTLINVPKDLRNTFLRLFALPNDSRVWGITLNNIFAEVEGNKLQKVVTVPSKSKIDVPGFVKSVEGSILFQVENKADESTTNYFLREVSPTANCEIMLDLDKPILLDPELNN
jgi:hypothetical protein